MPQQELYDQALAYHRQDPPGKLSIQPTKSLGNQRDLAMAYSPGVAAACKAIVDDEQAVASVTARGNLVAVVSNGTAVLGLGAIGPLASKPVMEGKAVLFKKFAGIDVFDLEVDAKDPEKLVDVVVALEPTFGGINLEDIKAPECFVVEEACKRRMKIPVFHDDQHGTAICVAAAVYNALELVDKKLEEIKIVASGAGAAALASLDLLVRMGATKANIVVTDIVGVVYEGREEEMDEYKARYAVDTQARTLSDVIDDADLFLGLSAPNVLKVEYVKRMARDPLILAMANPVPEIMPEEALAARSDVILATGRSDYPNQVNNVLCFPFLFRGALDVGATEINEEMKIAAAKAIADLARAEPSDVVQKAYGDHSLHFGRDYILPKPFDPRLILEVAPAVARAAMETGVARRPIEDFDAYGRRLAQFVYQSQQAMQPVFEEAQQNPKRVVFAEGEDDRVLSAVQIVLDEGLAVPLLVGRRQIVAARIQKLGLSFRLDQDVTLIDPEHNPEVETYAQRLYALTARRGISPEMARDIAHTRTTAISALSLLLDKADAVICGAQGAYQNHLQILKMIIGHEPGASACAALQVLLTSRGVIFMTDTEVTYDPSAEELCEIALRAAGYVRRFALTPRVALLSHSNFGSSNAPSAAKMKRVRELMLAVEPELMVEGEMRGNLAVEESVRSRLFPESMLKGMANLMVMPNADAANIAFNLAKSLTGGLGVGPILMGMARPVHIVDASIGVRGLVNMAAMAVVDAHTVADSR